jgi:hypothetical protein
MSKAKTYNIIDITSDFYIKAVIQRTFHGAFLEQSWLRVLGLEMCHNIPIWSSVFWIHYYRIIIPEYFVLPYYENTSH